MVTKCTFLGFILAFASFFASPQSAGALTVDVNTHNALTEQAIIAGLSAAYPKLLITTGAEEIGFAYTLASKAQIVQRRTLKTSTLVESTSLDSTSMSYSESRKKQVATRMLANLGLGGSLEGGLSVESNRNLDIETGYQESRTLTVKDNYQRTIDDFSKYMTDTKIEVGADSGMFSGDLIFRNFGTKSVQISELEWIAEAINPRTGAVLRIIDQGIIERTITIPPHNARDPSYRLRVQNLKLNSSRVLDSLMESAVPQLRVQNYKILHQEQLQSPSELEEQRRRTTVRFILLDDRADLTVYDIKVKSPRGEPLKALLDGLAPHSIRLDTTSDGLTYIAEVDGIASRFSETPVPDKIFENELSEGAWLLTVDDAPPTSSTWNDPIRAGTVISITYVRKADFLAASPDRRTFLSEFLGPINLRPPATTVTRPSQHAVVNSIIDCRLNAKTRSAIPKHFTSRQMTFWVKPYLHRDINNQGYIRVRPGDKISLSVRGYEAFGRVRIVSPSTDYPSLSTRTTNLSDGQLLSYREPWIEAGIEATDHLLDAEIVPINWSDLSDESFRLMFSSGGKRYSLREIRNSLGGTVGSLPDGSLSIQLDVTRSMLRGEEGIVCIDLEPRYRELKLGRIIDRSTSTRRVATTPNQRRAIAPFFMWERDKPYKVRRVDVWTAYDVDTELLGSRLPQKIPTVVKTR